MIIRKLVSRLLLLILAGVGAETALAELPRWPGGRTAAIVLTYDDAIPTHLDVAAPQLEAAGLRGTFFLNGTFPAAQVPSWRRLAQAGHELGNHSLFHPCPRGSFAMEPQQESERYSVAGMLREIGAMNSFLAAIDGRADRTYAVPCNVARAGGVDYTEALRASGLVRYVRAGAPGGGVVDRREALDPFRVPSSSFPETATAEDLIAYVRQVERLGGMAVITFHGVGGDHLSVSAEAHLGLVRYLAANRARIWVAPFREVMDHASSAAIATGSGD